MTDDRDDLEAFVAERTAANPRFPKLVEQAERRRALLRALAEERTRQALTQEQVAALMHTSQSAVARLEAGETDARLSSIERYAEAIGKRIDWTLVDA